MSARYIPLPDENYIPTMNRIIGGINQVTSNKQAQSVTNSMISYNDASAWQGDLAHIYKTLEEFYQQSLNSGIPKELARIILPVGRYSKMRTSANLRNWLHFLSLRMDPNAQWEIQQYANAVGEIIQQLFPRTWELFYESK
jgi:thymidylate synthase (FAD)